MEALSRVSSIARVWRQGVASCPALRRIVTLILLGLRQRSMFLQITLVFSAGDAVTVFLPGFACRKTYLIQIRFRDEDVRRKKKKKKKKQRAPGRAGTDLNVMDAPYTKRADTLTHLASGKQLPTAV